MKSEQILGRINSIQSLGTVDGPGIRYVVFLQGCNLRCGCCHNPDTWGYSGGTLYSPADLADNTERYRSYFGENGGITVSGGEPLLQSEFVTELFKECHKRDINTCLDTSGSIFDDKIKEMLVHTDRVLLDIKYTTDEMYREFVGCSIDAPLKFLSYLDEVRIPVTIRQVIIPTLNDNEENIARLNQILEKYSCVDKVELLPFKKICKVKYDQLGIKFRFDEFPQPTSDSMEYLQSLL